MKPNSSLASPSSASNVDQNKHVREYLNYYIEFTGAPRYAVLLKGAWGIGKTYLVRQILDNHFSDRDGNYIYLSLYGLSSYEDLDRALRNAIFPILNKKSTIVGTKIAKALLGAVKINTNLNIGDFTSKFKEALYVFDDLERCALPMQKIMGYINEFVEHDSCKVIIIANEEAIKDQPDYLERREKTVGKMLEVQPSVDNALDSFLSKVEDSETRDFLKLNSDQVTTLFANSGLNNLRVLQQTIWDFERLYKIVGVGLRQRIVGMRVLMSLLFAFSFEAKAGRLSEQEIRTRHNYQWFRFVKEEKESEPLSRMQIAIKRYVGIDLTDAILSDEILAEILFKGLLRSEEINANLIESHHFQEAEEQAPWRLIWNFLSISDDVFVSALKKMERQFLRREFVKVGEIFHVFGLRLWCAKEGLLELSRDTVVEQGKLYIDDLINDGRLDNLEAEVSARSFSSYDGLGVHERESDDFKILAEYFTERHAQARQAQHPAKGQEILNDMRENKDVFPKIALQAGVSSPYYRIPILATIDPKEFVRTWLQMEPTAQKNLAYALDGRYDYGGLGTDLKSELPWLHQVKAEFEHQLGRKSRPTHVRFSWLLNWSVNKYISDQQFSTSAYD